MIKKFNLIILIFLNLIFILILLLSNNKTYINKEAYVIKYDYSLSYSKSKTMNINIISYEKNPIYIQSDRNIYSISDNLDFYYTLQFRDVTFTYKNDRYIYELVFDIPYIDSLYIRNLYFYIENDYSVMTSLLGSLYISKKETNEVLYKNYYGDSELVLNNIYIELTSSKYKNFIINSSPSIYIDYSFTNNILKLDLSSNNLINNLFIDILIDDTRLFIDNFYYVSYDFSIDNYLLYSSRLSKIYSEV